MFKLTLDVLDLTLADYVCHYKHNNVVFSLNLDCVFKLLFLLFFRYASATIAYPHTQDRVSNYTAKRASTNPLYIYCL